MLNLINSLINKTRQAAMVGICGLLLNSTMLTSANASEVFSQDLSRGSATITQGSVKMLRGVGQITVASVTATGDLLNVVAKVGHTASTIALNITGEGLGRASVAVGQVLNLVTVSTGVMIIASGQVLAMIPNQVGQALLKRTEI